MLAVETLTSHAGLDALRAEWNALAEGAPTPLLRHAWFLAAARTFAADAELAIFTARRDGRLRAVAPMVVDRSTVVPRLRILGFETREPEAFLHDDAEALAAVCSAVLAAGRPIVLPRMDAASPEWGLLGGLSPRKGLGVLRPSTNSYHVTVLQKDWAAFEGAMSSKKRSELRRLRRGLEKHGQVTFEVLSPTEDTVGEGMAELLRVEAASWKSRSGTAMASKALLARFMSEYARLAAREGLLRLSFLRLAGEPIVVQMDVEHGGRLWGLKMGTDERWLKYAPGILSTHELFRWASERGLAACEHLGEAEEWQRRWPYEVRERSTFRFYPRRPGAALALGLDAVQFARRGAKMRALARARAAEKARAAA